MNCGLHCFEQCLVTWTTLTASTNIDYFFFLNILPENSSFPNQNMKHYFQGKFITMTSQWSRWRLESPASRLFTQPFIQGADQRKHQSSASLAFVRGIHRWLVNSPHKGLVTRKMSLFDDVIMLHESTVCKTSAILFRLFKCDKEILPTDFFSKHKTMLREFWIS